MFYPVPQPSLAIHRSLQGRGQMRRGKNLRISGKIEHEPSKLLVFIHKQWGTYRSNPIVCVGCLPPWLRSATRRAMARKVLCSTVGCIVTFRSEERHHRRKGCAEEWLVGLQR